MKKRLIALMLTIALCMGAVACGKSGNASGAEQSLPNTEDFEYTYTSSGDIMITGYSGSATNLVIPSEIDGDKVVTIFGGFEGNKKITSITIPDTVEYIGAKAFYGCKNVTSVKLQEGLREIGDSAFGSCTGLKEVYIPDSVNLIGEDAFRGDSLETVHLPANAEHIFKGAFCGNSIKGVLTIPGSVKYVETYSFADLHDVEEIVIEDGVERIDEDAFAKCKNLKKVTIPSSVTGVADAFNGCSDVKFVVDYGSAGHDYVKEEGFDFEVR